MRKWILLGVAIAALLAPGSASGATLVAPEGTYVSLWATAAPEYCSTPMEAPPYVVTPTPGAYAQTIEKPDGTRELHIAPGTWAALAYAGSVGDGARFILLHEWAHYHQVSWVFFNTRIAEPSAMAQAERLAGPLLGLSKKHQRGLSHPRAVRWVKKHYGPWFISHGQFGC